MSEDGKAMIVECPFCAEEIGKNAKKCPHCAEILTDDNKFRDTKFVYGKINRIERVSYAGGIYGLVAGSSKGKLQNKIDKMNSDGWNLHFIHPESLNLIKVIIRVIILILTLLIWTIGYSELLIFEKERH